MRLDHLLSKEEKSKGCLSIESSRMTTVTESAKCLLTNADRPERSEGIRQESHRHEASGGDTLRGNTRTHPEHDG